ncbi:helix-turn-helix domain-containing protein [Citricoccus nitrophenolicus]|uniref:helix-turn-helix domain-containing protein n=1 Tax=Citricoccus nitrophenolicus TaxID=863575 RepID=UPI0031E5FE80
MDIKAERIAAGMTQSTLAQAASVPQPNLSAYENGRRSPSPEVLGRITAALQKRPSFRVDHHRVDILSLLVQYHASHPRLIGSVARGEDRPDSDVDLLVDFSEDASFLDEVGLRRALTDLLRVNVDVVASDTLRGAQRDRMLKDAVPL